MGLGLILDFVSGVPLVQIIKGGKAAVDKLLKLDPDERLLWLISEQFGDDLGLTRKEITGWLDVDALGDAIVGVVQGSLTNQPEHRAYLQSVLRPQLKDVEEEKRDALAAEITTGMFLLAPYLERDLSQGVAHLSNKLDQLQGILLKGDERSGSSTAAEALLRGPLVQIGQVDDAENAAEFAKDGKFDQAASILEEIAGALKAEGLGPVAETYLIAAAESSRQAGDEDRAVLLLREAAIDQVARRSSGAILTLRKLESMLPHDRKWEAEALGAEIHFAFDPEGSMRALRTAYEKRKAEGDADQELAALCDTLAFFGQHEEVASLTATVPAQAPTAEANLRIKLDRLDALGWDKDADQGKIKRQWDELLRHLDAGDNKIWAGIAWQRRGMTLAHEGDIDGCHDAYHRAMAAFSVVPGFEEQAADALYSLQAASIMNGQLPPEMDLRALAYEQRGLPTTPVARGDALSQLAMAHRIAEKYREGLQEYSCSLQIHQVNGSLQGHLEVSDKLAELFEATGRPALATANYIAAGKPDKASAAARKADPEELASVIHTDGARWEQAATLAVIAAVGPTLPESLVAEVGPWVIEVAGESDDSPRPPHPPHQARLALPKLLLNLPEDVRSKAVAQVEADLENPHVDLRWEAEKGLEQAVRLQLADSSRALVESFARDPYNSRVSLDFIVDQIKSDPALAELVRSVAVDSTPALAAMSIADKVAGDSELEAAAQERAERLSEAINVKQDERQVSMGFGRSFEIDAIAIFSAPVDARWAAITRLLEIANDANDSEGNRQSAATALFNLAEAIPDDQVKEVLDGLAPLAHGDYPLSPWDENRDDPLSAFRISFHTQAALWAAAIGAMGRLLEQRPDLPRDQLISAATVTLQRGPDRAVAAALDALGHATDVELPGPLEPFLLAKSESIQFAALGCWAARRKDLPDGEILDQLLVSDSVAVRHRTVLLLVESEQMDLVKRLADGDPHALVRRVAAQRL